VTLADIRYADGWDYVIKLLGIVDSERNQAVRVRVHPALVPKNHPLGSVHGVYNALWFRGDFVGDVMFSGRGAGSDPTGSAVIGDLIDVARDIRAGTLGTPLPYGKGMQTVSMDDLQTAYYLRMLVVDKPKTLGEIAMALGEFNVGLAEMEMSTLPNDQGEIVFLTHPAKESDFWKAIERLKSLPVVHSVASTIRISERV
jgi:homoserine dehydrogenase